MPLQSDQEIAIVLQVQEWDVIFRALGDLPYRFAQPVIQKMAPQLQKHADAETSPAPGAKMNGSGELTGVTNNE